MCSQEKTLQETLNNAYKRMLGIFREKLGSTGLPPAISVLSAAGQDSQGKCGADEENQIKTKWQTPPETLKIASSKCFRAKGANILIIENIQPGEAASPSNKLSSSVVWKSMMTPAPSRSSSSLLALAMLL